MGGKARRAWLPQACLSQLREPRWAAEGGRAGGWAGSGGNTVAGLGGVGGAPALISREQKNLSLGRNSASVDMKRWQI